MTTDSRVFFSSRAIATSFVNAKFVYLQIHLSLWFSATSMHSILQSMSSGYVFELAIFKMHFVVVFTRKVSDIHFIFIQHYSDFFIPMKISIKSILKKKNRKKNKMHRYRPYPETIKRVHKECARDCVRQWNNIRSSLMSQTLKSIKSDEFIHHSFRCGLHVANSENIQMSVPYNAWRKNFEIFLHIPSNSYRYVVYTVDIAVIEEINNILDSEFKRLCIYHTLAKRTNHKSDPIVL